MLKPRYLEVLAYLVGVTGQVFILTLALFLIMAAWWLFGERVRAWARETFEPVGNRWRAWATRQAERRITNAVVHLEPIAPDTSRREWQGIVEAVKAWCAYVPLMVLWHVVKLTVLLVLLFNIGAIMTTLTHSPQRTPWFVPSCWKLELAKDGSGAGDCEPKGAGPLAALWAPGRETVTWVGESVAKAVTDPWEAPVRTITTAVAVVLLVMLTVIVCALVPTLRHFFAEKGGRYAQEPRESRAGTDLARELGRWRPVVVLLTVCGNIGHTYRQLESSDVRNAPRVSLKPAERVVHAAWRTRHGRVRFARRHELAEHAARVVGAIRAMESRQDRDADTKKVLEDTSAMLLKISERYAAGRTLELLDPEDLEGSKPVVSREWLRAAFMATAVVGVTAGALAAGLPEGAATPLIGATSLIAWGIAYGGRMVGSGLVDVMRGQSRSA
ncbi:hypothetical protein [Streptomyces sp. NPDC056938]|uniref:hypothetical protein n=1 Tax=Streptomyces sp. NPDC056938 TaxID=3345970 RepID=UPI00363D2457